MSKITNELIQKMLREALLVREKAYVPYSKFKVGACVCAEDGELFTGCNVENASFRLTNCAETSAICNMIAAGKKRILAILIVGPNITMITPCGACRQVIREFAALDAPIYLCDDTNVLLKTTVAELLPLSFGPEHLPIKKS